MKSLASSDFSTLNLLRFFIYTLLISSSVSQRCRPGSFRNGTSCSLCPIATWQDRIEASSCQPCPSGRTTLSIGSQGRDLCTVCPGGTFMDGIQCIPCPSGTTSRRRATNISNCLACGPGTVLSSDGTQCEQCPAGTFSSDETNLRCQRCPANSFSARGSENVDACETVVCSPGRQHDGAGGCQRCFEGDFKAERSSQFCERCPMGTFSERGARQCTPCPTGTIQEFRFGACERCGPGFTSLGVGATVCRRRRGPCPVDAIETEDGACVRCQNDQRVNPRTGLCETCPPNSVALAPNATKCTRCPAGMAGSPNGCVCSPGSMLVNGRCAACEPGTVSSNGEPCEQCFEGRIAPERGMSSCRRCPAGLIASEDSLRCIPCPEGTASNIGPLLFVRDLMLLSIDECRNVQSGCPNGFTRSLDIDQCIPPLCRRNTPEGANCRRCDPGFLPNRFIFDASETCSKCIFGTVSDGLACRRCPKGMRQLFRDPSQCVCSFGIGLRNGRCLRCLPGTFSGEEDEVCLPCPAGTFSSQPRSISCENCPADMFSSTEGAVHCEACPAGTFTYGEGETECLAFIQ